MSAATSDHRTSSIMNMIAHRCHHYHHRQRHPLNPLVTQWLLKSQGVPFSTICQHGEPPPVGWLSRHSQGFIIPCAAHQKWAMCAAAAVGQWTPVACVFIGCWSRGLPTSDWYDEEVGIIAIIIIQSAIIFTQMCWIILRLAISGYNIYASVPGLSALESNSGGVPATGAYMITIFKHSRYGHKRGNSRPITRNSDDLPAYQLLWTMSFQLWLSHW